MDRSWLPSAIHSTWYGTRDDKGHGRVVACQVPEPLAEFLGVAMERMGLGTMSQMIRFYLIKGIEADIEDQQQGRVDPFIAQWYSKIQSYKEQHELDFIKRHAQWTLEAIEENTDRSDGYPVQSAMEKLKADVLTWPGSYAPRKKALAKIREWERQQPRPSRARADSQGLLDHGGQVLTIGSARGGDGNGQV